MCSTQPPEMTLECLTPIPTSLEERLAALETEVAEFASATVLRVEDSRKDLETLADKTAQGLAHLAVAIVESQRKKPSRWDEFKQFFREVIYDARPVRLDPSLPTSDVFDQAERRWRYRDSIERL